MGTMSVEQVLRVMGINVSEELSNYDRIRRNLSKCITQKIYAEVVIELQGDDEDRECVDQKYQQKILELPTHQLELILQTHEEGLFNRRDDTIDVIVSELARRVLVENE